MPYINQKHRDLLDSAIADLVTAVQNANSDSTSNHKGNLNYSITRLIKEIYPPVSYHNINDAIGVLDCVSKEYYRRHAVPYEDKKIAENGDV